LAIFTLGFSEIVRITIASEDDVTAGMAGLHTEPLFASATRLPYFYVAFALLAASLLLMGLLVRSRWGLFLRAIREDEQAAAAAGLRHRVAAHHALGAQRAVHAVVAAVSTVGGGARRTARRGADGAAQGARHVSGRTELVRGVGLVKWFGGIVGNDAVDFVVAEGDLVGLIGPNGSGKTTLINLLTGHLAADGGEVRVRGQRVSGRPPHVYAAMGVA